MNTILKKMRDDVWEILLVNKNYQRLVNQNWSNDSKINTKVTEIVSKDLPETLTLLLSALKLNDYLITKTDFDKNFVKPLSIIRIIDDFPDVWERSLQFEGRDKKILNLLDKLSYLSLEIKTHLINLKKEPTNTVSV